MTLFIIYKSSHEPIMSNSRYYIEIINVIIKPIQKEVGYIFDMKLNVSPH